jgi:hypothetical protein
MGALTQGGEMGRYFAARKDGLEPTFDDLPPLADD